MVPNSEGAVSMLSFVSYSRAMPNDVERWELLADMVKAARDVLGMSSQSQLADAAGVAVGTVQRLEGGKPYPRLPNRTPAIERALGWPPGTARKIVEGEIDKPPIQALPVGDEASEALALARSLEPEDRQAYRETLEAARSLSAREKRRLMAELFDEASPSLRDHAPDARGVRN